MLRIWGGMSLQDGTTSRGEQQAAQPCRRRRPATIAGSHPSSSWRVVFFCAASFCISACASLNAASEDDVELHERIVRDRATFDLGCHEIGEVQKLGARTYGVNGCGRNATYIVRPTKGAGCRRYAKRHYADTACVAVLNSLDGSEPNVQ